MSNCEKKEKLTLVGLGVTLIAAIIFNLVWAADMASYMNKNASLVVTPFVEGWNNSVVRAFSFLPFVLLAIYYGKNLSVFEKMHKNED